MGAVSTLAGGEKQNGHGHAKGSCYVQPCPSPNSGFFSLLLDGLEKAFVWAFYDTTKPLHYLNGNFGPTDETCPRSDLPVTGHLPSCLNGEFVRVGPNPKYKPVAGYHWFDGDGMIHGLRIKDGKATFVSRYVRTSRLMQEEFFGGPKFLKIGDLKGFFGLFMAQIMKYRAKFQVIDTSLGTGTGNTALTYHNGMLLALHEGDKPYAIKVLEDGDLQTLGYLDYGQQLNHPFTAHPKVDPVTGEMFTFGYQFEPPYCTYRVVSKDGEMQDAVPISVSGPCMMHDFAITENYAIFMDMPLYFKPEAMLKGNLILHFDSSKKAKFGILPRYAKNESQIQWFELPTCYIFHNANAWEEGDEVVLYSCLLPTVDLEMASGPLKREMQSYKNELYELRFNLKTGCASQKQLSVSSVDFPRINEKHTGRKQRYVYGTILDKNAKIEGIVKFDLESVPELDGKEKIEKGGNVEGVFSFGPGRFGSEAIFVPKTSGADESEDDGYLICFVYDENVGKSEAVVIDAKTMAPEPVAVVSLPSRVPYGFHAFFVTQEQLDQQKV